MLASDLRRIISTTERHPSNNYMMAINRMARYALETCERPDDIRERDNMLENQVIARTVNASTQSTVQASDKAPVKCSLFGGTFKVMLTASLLIASVGAHLFTSVSFAQDSAKTDTIEASSRQHASYLMERGWYCERIEQRVLCTYFKEVPRQTKNTQQTPQYLRR